jgi:transcriptional regulator with XRE-family HTH domain
MVLVKNSKTRIKMKRVPPEAAIIGDNLCALRRERGFTQQEIASVLNVTFQQVQKYERGENRLPVEKLHKLKNYFAVPYELFFKNMPMEYGEMEIDISLRWPDNLCAQLAEVDHPARRDKIRRVVAILLEP